MITWLRDDIDEAHLYDFAEGILPEGFPQYDDTQRHPQAMTPDGTVWRMRSTPNMDDQLSTILAYHLASVDDACCLFEDNGIDATFLRAKPKVRTTTYGNEVYRGLIRGDTDAELISNTIRTARSWLFVGALTYGEKLTSNSIAEVGSLRAEDIEAAAERAVGLVVGAYDFEGFLVWRP